MNRALLPDMLHSTDMTVPERQSARLKWQQEQQILHQQQMLQQQQRQQQQQQQEGYFGDLSSVFQVQGFPGGGGLGEVMTLSTASSVKPEPALVDNGWPDFLGFGSSGGYGNNNNGSGLEFNDATISRVSSCQPMVAEAAAAEKGRESLGSGKVNSGVGTESFKRSRVDGVHNNAEVVTEDETRDKRIRGFQGEGKSKITEKTSNKSSNGKNNKSSNNNKLNNSSSSNKENSAETSKDNSKVTEVQKPDYIHVRARRGQATDSHSLAERVRRERISERMKYLQDLVPGCNKTMGKAGMLDEIINYVQSLQRQVEFLSMKLAAVNRRLDSNIDSLLAKEVFATCGTSFPPIGVSSDLANPAYHQFNPVQQPIVTCGLDMGMNASDMELKRTISAPVSIPEPFLDTSCFTQIQPSSNWNVDLQSLYNVAFDQGRPTSFSSLSFTGPLDAGNLKTEM